MLGAYACTWAPLLPGSRAPQLLCGTSVARASSELGGVEHVDARERRDAVPAAKEQDVGADDGGGVAVDTWVRVRVRVRVRVQSKMLEPMTVAVWP